MNNKTEAQRVGDLLIELFVNRIGVYCTTFDKTNPKIQRMLGLVKKGLAVFIVQGDQSLWIRGCLFCTDPKFRVLLPEA